MLRYPTVIILAVALFIIGISTYGEFLMWALPKIKGLTFQANSFTGFNGMIGFSLTLALIPLSVFLIWTYAPILKIQRRILTVLIIISSICLFALTRHQWIAIKVTYLQNLPESIDGTPIQTVMPLENFNITTYMFFGLIAGSAISYFALREFKIRKY